MDKYTIYLVNESADRKLFWCFLELPQELVTDRRIYANSSASLSVDPNESSARFVIPVQYVVGAGASHNAVGLNVVLISSTTTNADLTDTWQANYANTPPNMGPGLTRDQLKTGAHNIAIKSNNFDNAGNESKGWFSNQSFGIQTEAGFIGMTWSPRPGQTRTLTPRLIFYVAVGNYNSNSLAAWTTISSTSQVVQAPDDFENNECTVTYKEENGAWSVRRGKPFAME
jgi:hypothetical protein